MQLLASKSKLKIVFSLIFIGCYFYGLSLTHDLFFLTSSFLLLFYIVLMLFSCRQIVNPLSLLFPFVLSFYYYQFMISSKQEILSFMTTSAIFLFIICYMIGFYVCMINSSKVKNNKHINVEIKKSALDFMLFLSLGVFLFECYFTGGFPFFIALFDKVNIYADMYYVPILHYLVMLVAIYPAVYYSLFKKNRITKIYFIFVSSISIFILLNIMSRQIVIMSLVFFIYMYIKENKLNLNKYVVRFSIGAAMIFMALGFIRIQSINDNVSQLEYLKVYSGVPLDRDVNTFDITFNLYASQNISTLNNIISSTNDFGFGSYVLKPIIKTFKFDELFNIEYPENLDSFSRLGTIIADPYVDFGLVGTALFGFLYGLINTIVYLYYIYTDNIRYILLWSLTSFIMVMSVFTNFYNTLFSWIVFSLSFLLISRSKAKL